MSNLMHAACQTETHCQWATIAEARALRPMRFSSGHVSNTHHCFDIQVFTMCVTPLFRRVKLVKSRASSKELEGPHHGGYDDTIPDTAI